MSIDSIIYVVGAVIVLSAALGGTGYIFHDDIDESPGLIGTLIIGGVLAILWPVVLGLAVLSTPYWAGRALAAHRQARAKRKALARQETLDRLVFLLGELNEASVAHQVVKEQLAELGRNQ